MLAALRNVRRPSPYQSLASAEADLQSAIRARVVLRISGLHHVTSLLGFGVGLQAQDIPSNIGPKVFTAHAGFTLDDGAKFCRNRTLPAQQLADKLRAAIDRSGKGRTATLVVNRALNGFVHEA